MRKIKLKSDYKGYKKGKTHTVTDQEARTLVVKKRVAEYADIPAPQSKAEDPPKDQKEEEDKKPKSAKS